MGELTLTLLIPALALALMGWAVPRMLFHVFPEGVKPLLLLALCSVVLMLILGIGFFTVLYMAQGINWEALTRDGWGPFVGHFLRLGAISSLLWGPVLVLSVAGLPRRWKREVW